MTSPTNTSATPTEISPDELAQALVRGERVTVLDVRGEGSPAIEAASAEALSADAAAVLDGKGPSEALEGAREPLVVACNRGRTAGPVAQALRGRGLDARVLAGGVRAWIGTLVVAPLDLGIPGLEALQVQRPARGCLSYVLAAEGRAVVIDPAPDAERYIEIAAELGARVTDVIDTHLHADHLSGARALSELAGAKLRLPRATLDERGISFASDVVPLEPGERLELGGVELEVVPLPGHTTDMTGVLVGSRALVSGDSLFADGIARPDLERGDPEGAHAMARRLHATLRETVLGLGDDVVILPGHTHPGVREGAVVATVAEARAGLAELSIEDASEFASRIVADLPPRPANYEAVIAVNAGRAPHDPELEEGGNSCATSSPPAGSAKERS